jgi:hypothetical protein
MGPVVTIVLLIYQQSTGKPLTWGWFAALIFAGLYLHYKSELAKQRKQEKAVPLLSLGYDRYFGGPDTDDCYSGFYLRTEDELRASNVHLGSEETVGHAHKRLYMRWKDPTHEIGMECVAIEVTCMYWEKDVPHPCGGIGRYQIDSFFKAKKKEPKELIVTVSYTDMQGNPCPPRRFKITQTFENVLKDKVIISCQPVKT